MAFPLSVFLAQVDNLLDADSDIISQLSRYRQVRAAVERYSRDRPDSRADDVTGDGGRYYGIAASLSGWVEGFSRILSIEYPAADLSAGETPIYFEPEDWRDDYWKAVASVQTRYLYLPNHAPAATETMRITYAIPYAWSAGATTTAVSQTAHGFSVNDYVYQDGSTWYKAADARVATHRVTAVGDANSFTVAILQTTTLQEDFFAICYLAAGLCCQAMAAKFARSGESTIGADSVNHTSKSQEYAKRAKEFITMYEKHLGLGEEADTKASGDFVDWDTAPGWPVGRDYLFHGRGTR